MVVGQGISVTSADSFSNEDAYLPNYFADMFSVAEEVIL